MTAPTNPTTHKIRIRRCGMHEQSPDRLTNEQLETISAGEGVSEDGRVSANVEETADLEASANEDASPPIENESTEEPIEGWYVGAGVEHSISST
jgi:hypothetical protein